MLLYVQIECSFQEETPAVPSIHHYHHYSLVPLQAVYLIDKKGDNSTYFGFDL